jgi:hypothetical protein
LGKSGSLIKGRQIPNISTPSSIKSCMIFRDLIPPVIARALFPMAFQRSASSTVFNL